VNPVAKGISTGVLGVGVVSPHPPQTQPPPPHPLLVDVIPLHVALQYPAFPLLLH